VSSPRATLSKTGAVPPVDSVSAAPLAFRLLHGFLALLSRIFFSRIEVVGLEHIPAEGGGIVVSWHPNGLIDPGLIVTSLPRRVVFGARHGLFKWPLLAALMRKLGTVSMHVGRGAANPDRRRFNMESLEQLAAEVAKGRLTALFPEGISHDAPHPMELKLGAARLYYRARALQEDGAPPPMLLPVGLHYDQKRLFRSRALVRFHPPMIIPPSLDVRPGPDEPDEIQRDRCRALTSEIGHVLQDAVLATESWSTHRLLTRANSLMHAEYAARRRRERDSGSISFSDLASSFARIRSGYLALTRTEPETASAVRSRLSRYDAGLRRLGLEDEDLDRDPRLIRPWITLVAQIVLVFLLMPPLLLWGYAVNGPTALVLLALAKAFGRTRSDEATIKILCGAVLFPLTWIGVGVGAGLGYVELQSQFSHLPRVAPLQGVAAAALSVAGGVLALRWIHLAKETMRSVRVRIVRRRRRSDLEALRVERASLYATMLRLRPRVTVREACHAATPIEQAVA
jgi:glycerol-3-phosphate O-acyltransferase / dihydroxyacetone phosphate acyltransferase